MSIGPRRIRWIHVLIGLPILVVALVVVLLMVQLLMLLMRPDSSIVIIENRGETTLTGVTVISPDGDRYPGGEIPPHRKLTVRFKSRAEGGIFVAYHDGKVEVMKQIPSYVGPDEEGQVIEASLP